MVVFCSDHGQPCCSKCQKELHRQCKQVISLQHPLPKPPTRPVAGESGHTAVPTHSAKTPLKQKHAKSQMVTDKDHKRPYKLIERKVKIHKDKHSCSVYGITVLPGGEIILTDAANSKLKLLSADYTVVDHVSVPQEPRGICAVSDNHVAVCNRTKEIQFYNVIHSKLKMDRTLQMDHICRYVSYMPGHLYITSKDTVYKYTLAGQRVRKIYTLNGGCIWGIAVSPDGGRLYVTDVNNQQLVTVDMHGRVLAILKDEELRFPEGVCVSPRGRVIVCGWKSGTILQVDSSGNHKLATLANKKDGVPSPLSVFFDSRTSSLVEQEYTDHILVLILK